MVHEERVRVSWWDPTKGRKTTGGRLPTGSRVGIHSSPHLIAPGGYEVLRKVPRLFVGMFGYRWAIEEYLAASMDPDKLGTAYSEEWSLGAANRQSGEAVFRARVAGDSDRDNWAQTLRSTLLFLDEYRKSATASVSPTVEAAHVGVAAGKAELGVTKQFTAAATVDPECLVSVLQGPDLLHHLLQLGEMEYQPERQLRVEDSSSESFFPLEDAGESNLERLDGLSAVYFQEEEFVPVPPGRVTITVTPEEPAVIGVGFPGGERVRGAISLVVTNLDSGESSVSPPIFATSIRGEVVLSSSLPELIPRPALEALVAFGDADGDVAALADRLGVERLAAVGMVQEAVEMLGTDTTMGAVGLASMMLTPA